MSNKIIERRKASNNVPEKSRAAIVGTEPKQKRSAVKGILLTIAIIVAIAALLFVVINALIKNVSESISPNGSYKDTIPSIAESFKENDGFYADKVYATPEYQKYAFLASNNHSAAVNNIKDSENVFNYAIYGVENADENVASSDIIVIASINKETNKLTYILLDDQTLVYIPYADVIAPLKHAYNLGGANLLSRTISQNFGIDIDGYVEMKMKGAIEMVDAVGGIDIAMTDEEVASLNTAIRLYNEQFGKEVLEITKKGETVSLNGEQTLAYLRGESGSDANAIFRILTEVTKVAIKDGVEGIVNLTEKLSENATTSTETDDFATLLKVAVETTGDALADTMNKINLDDISEKIRVRGDNRYVYFSAYDDYSKVVSDIQTVLYSE